MNNGIPPRSRNQRVSAASDIRVPLSQIGGIRAGRKLQVFAEQFGVRTAWHGPGDMSPLAHAANIHIDLASRNFGVQEWSGTEPPNFVIQELKGPRAGQSSRACPNSGTATYMRT
ncbi:enolase C-terminal domain-like protein [Burkholderia cepacia]|uniref:enolase C-terminal domain-like protein n=1 Tax=Burkholderia cepacia TaxID=292 RepID=UPI001FC82B08|nr:enolase C-terminal domain-like protein [Burkholderia cepacia]MDW9247848.1 enolase C-terminal domain-like family protein [Burkholderia cepacia]